MQVYLLEGLWGDFPSWIQAIVAIVAAILSGIAIFQSGKIKGLIDVTNELKNQIRELKLQNETLEKRFQLEKVSALTNVIPVFRWDHKDQNIPEKATIHLQNIGIEATLIKTDDRSNTNYTVHLWNHSAKNNDRIKIDISTKDGSPIENIEFNICATAINGIVSKQLIFKTPEHDLNIRHPEAEF